MTMASDLYNALPRETRRITKGAMLQRQLLDYQIEKERAKAAHRKHMRDVNDHIKTIERSIRDWEETVNNGEQSGD
jgi:hypothetical protein